LPESLRSDSSFYLVYPEDTPLNRAGQIFRDWLIGEAKAAKGG
jgi:DNA-binding transcriptional LysR family regulator